VKPYCYATDCGYEGWHLEWFDTLEELTERAKRPSYSLFHLFKRLDITVEDKECPVCHDGARMVSHAIAGQPNSEQWYSNCPKCGRPLRIPEEG